MWGLPALQETEPAPTRVSHPLGGWASSLQTLAQGYPKICALHQARKMGQSSTGNKLDLG